ncbi:hypothetical protein CSKR_109218 [Clonorchis sinensis]|uniref:Uncharacterized protein n=1 Tax=Clonorchis sinensis TaxID=79923 RepID=A0A3R7DP16_CLOSI|nr:hypothetical protein CSKR_109218 [Clonorchis sinensis]
MVISHPGVKAKSLGESEMSYMMLTWVPKLERNLFTNYPEIECVAYEGSLEHVGIDRGRTTGTQVAERLCINNHEGRYADGCQ